MVMGGANEFPAGIPPLWTTAFSRRTRVRRYTVTERGFRLFTHPAEA
jgi:hypothetical protein